MSPSLDSEIGLRVESDTKDDDCEEACDVARQLPIFPFTGLARRRWDPVEEVTIGALLVTGSRPSAWTVVGGEGPGEQPAAEHVGQGHRGGCCLALKDEGGIWGLGSFEVLFGQLFAYLEGVIALNTTTFRVWAFVG
ncbi:hypothetical protein V6N12_023210 [Hibiscus sabdariffa]|uniref:Uncharacterized protein n=1 Tax=Hibiscus sabdariffa TaxID=183260 RepID=A0ABR2FXV7_9ROSI